MRRDTEGILVLDEDGQTRFASGLGIDAAVAQTLSRVWMQRSGVPVKRLFALPGIEPAHSVAALVASQGVCFLIFAAGEGDELTEFIATVDCAADIFRYFITNPYEAMNVIDAAGNLLYMSPIHERSIGLKRGDAIGRPVRDVIENTRLQEVVMTGKPQIGEAHESHGVTRIVSRIPIFDRNRKLVAAIGQVMFKGPQAIPQAIQDISNELARVRQERDFYKRELSGIRNRSYGLDQIVGSSNAIKRLKEDVLRVAPLDVPVLLVGESGTGKELVAHALHLLSPRGDKSLTLVNAAAMPANLVESELFGYEGGAFTGADKRGRKGKFELSNSGSLFLDEIGDMPLEMQVKLLRVLQDGTFQRVGGDRLLHSDFRLISASHRDFQQMIADNTFRLDLFYRISAVTLYLPPLRDRLEDIPELADTFLAAFAKRQGVPKKSIDDHVIRYLQSCSWPGNVRQLQHAVERAAIFSDGDKLAIESFGGLERSADTGASLEKEYRPFDMPTNPGRFDVWEAKQRVELELIAEAMERTGGNKKRVAEELGISRSYLYKQLRMLEAGKTS
ncbi:sigma-54-dependent Fis family transcriptional regulator [Imbroritus primus]|uniref:Sigma-54-dependent Fis family transcriptional regulator n=1 Tax=Imbroritus primus TaxID=3058603 RepID=A0ACD3SQC7_9BURK|nr:sigma-54-dependent Fis family transcriptional regulator [Burkholderiaceae bacterium PBA]